MFWRNDMKRSVLFEKIIYSILAVLYSWSIIYSISYSMKLEMAEKNVFWICLVCMFILNILFIHKFAFLSGILVFAGTAAYYGWKIVKTGLYMEYYQRMLRFGTWFYHYITGKVFLDKYFGLCFVVMLSIIICSIVFIAFVKRYWFYTVFSGGILYSLITSLMGYTVYMPGMAVYAFCIICMLARKAYRYKIKQEKKDSSNKAKEYKYVLWSMPLAALTVLLAVSFSGYDFISQIGYNGRLRIPGWIEQNFRNIYTWYQNQEWIKKINMSEGSGFSLFVTGFQPKREYLGGNISLDGKLVLNVKTSSRVYLKGSIRDYYTGKGRIYTNNNEYTVKDTFIGNYITDSSFSEREHFLLLLHKERRNIDYNESYNRVFIEGQAEVQQVGFNTNAIFYPENLVYMLQWNHKNKSIYTNSNGEFYFSGRSMVDHAYSYQYRSVNRSDPLTEELLKKSSPEAIKPLLDRNPDLLEKYNEIMNKYTNTDNIKQSVAYLAQKVTENYSTRYEKVKAIEEYLSTQYLYTLSPGFPPEDRDFVEYFLFDIKKGYCSYYASAMTVMSRALGIPARYVEGYVLPANPDSNGIYRVTNDLAHAWVEVFFEGFGWVRFEPTAPFNALNRSQNIQDTFAEDITAQEYNHEEYLSHILGEENGTKEQKISPTDIPVQEKQQKEKDSKNIIFYIILSATALIIGIMVRRQIFIHKVGSLGNIANNSEVIKLYGRILKLIQLYGKKIEAGETLIEFAKRVDESFKNSVGSFEEVTLLYMKAKFGDIPLEKTEQQKFVGFYQSITADLRNRLPYFQLFYYRYILLMF